MQAPTDITYIKISDDSVRIFWTPPAEGVVDHYLVMIDGQTVVTIPAAGGTMYANEVKIVAGYSVDGLPDSETQAIIDQMLADGLTVDQIAWRNLGPIPVTGTGLVSAIAATASVNTLTGSSGGGTGTITGISATSGTSFLTGAGSVAGTGAISGISATSGIATLTGTPSTPSFDFSGTAGDGPPASYFTVLKSTNATAQLDGSGNLVITCSATSDYGMLYRTATITLAQTKSYRVRAKSNSPDVSKGHVILGVYNGSAPVYNVFDVVINVRRVNTSNAYVLYYDNAGAYHLWDGSAWSAANSGGSWLWSGADTSYVDCELITSATGWQLVLRNAAGTILSTTTEVAWSATKSPTSSASLYAGKWGDTSCGTLLIDSWVES